MPTHVRSYSKINLGLAIGPPRPDGFHGLVTLYQTLALHDVLTVVARPARATLITLRSNDRRVPLDHRNTVWKMVERTLAHLHRTAEVTVHIQKNLPIQGGMGAGSANAAAALLGLERQLGLSLGQSDRLRLAAEVGSDVPLFLVGGAVFGTDRGQQVAPAPHLTLAGQTEIPCVIALPGVGVSTPQAFRDWDALVAANAEVPEEHRSGHDLHNRPVRDTMDKLSHTYASVFPSGQNDAGPDRTGFTSASRPELELSRPQFFPEKPQETSSEQHHTRPEAPTSAEEDRGGIRNDPNTDLDTVLAENSLLALVRTGMENDFESVVFRQHPPLRDILQILKGPSETGEAAVYAALSGSGSAVFGLYRSQAHAEAAQQRLQHDGVEALVTRTLPRPLYWSDMFAE